MEGLPLRASNEVGAQLHHMLHGSVLPALGQEEEEARVTCIQYQQRFKVLERLREGFSDQNVTNSDPLL